MHNDEASKCGICGMGPTVESHIIPRALTLDIKGAHKHLVAGSINAIGKRFLQNGRFDRRILCAAHEDAIGPLDNYGVKFIRKASKAIKVLTGDGGIRVDNPSPSLLHRFVLSVLLRKDLSLNAGSKRSHLGPYRSLIEAAVFDDMTVNMPTLFLQSNVTISGRHAPIAVEPTPNEILNRHSWQTSFGWIETIIKLDKQPWPPEIQKLDASAAEVVTIYSTSPTDIREATKFHPVLSQMLRRRSKA